MRESLDLKRVDVDFSLALHNRTGKYFIGRDILADQADLIGKIYYWRMSLPKPPVGLGAKILGRALVTEQTVRSYQWGNKLPGHRPKNPLLHLDPSTVLYTALEARDVVLCHDLGPITHPELFAPGVSDLYSRAYGAIGRVAPTVVFVSESSRQAFIRLYGSLPIMPVVYPPIRAEVKDAPVTPVKGLDSPFFLTVGSLGHRKNQVASIRAFAKSGLAAQGVTYVLCGPREPGADEVEAAAAATANVCVLAYVSDAELAWLYANAMGFVLASKLEGFGVPVAEAIARGLVPIVSQDSVLTEVAGDGALTADPMDEQSIAAAVLGLTKLTETEKANRLVKLRASITRFSRGAFSQAWSQVLSDAARAE